MCSNNLWKVLTKRRINMKIHTELEEKYGKARIVIRLALFFRIGRCYYYHRQVRGKQKPPTCFSYAEE